MNDMPALEIINDTELQMDLSFLKRLAAEILRQECPQLCCYATLYLCEDMKMQGLNKLYRGSQGATDVLAFKATQTGLETQENAGSTFLGDIVVDINQASRQKGKNTIQVELQLLAIHGLLHLLGYDHIKTQDKKNMEHKENYYRQKLVGA